MATGIVFLHLPLAIPLATGNFISSTWSTAAPISILKATIFRKIFVNYLQSMDSSKET